ncbi:MAG: uracil phosphoribosyltransferase [Cyclobacteriaceae bacterium]|nr:uracil phosphoribosyltransferase [Cyclobacteriaceae bacterium]
MNVNNLSLNNTVLNAFIAELRNVDVQRDAMRFRRNLERTGEIMAYELSRTLTYRSSKIQTPLASMEVNLIANDIVIGTVFRAGLPFHNGFLNFFDHAENAFVSAFRKYRDNEKFDIEIEYIAAPNLKGKTLILADTMLATGLSFELALQALLTKGEPDQIHLCSVIASAPGIEYLQRKLNNLPVTLWCAAVDPELNEHAYIVPGLGDAGDLAYGLKL